MDSDELVETLETAGLSPYQSEAYVTLLELGAASATQVADASDVPAPRIYDVLESLESHGYVETYETDTLKVRAHSPGAVLDDLRDRADRFEAAAAEVERRWEQPELENNGTSIVKRYRTVLEQAEAFIEQAEYQIQASVTVEDLERLRPLLVAARERGVSVRLSVHTSPDGDPPEESLLAGACLEARHRRLPAPFVVLVDREKTCFCHHPDSSEQYGVLVNDSTHTYVFHWYFLTCLWEQWETVYSDYADSFPVEYVDVRQCVRDLRPLLSAEATVRVHVEGTDVETGETVSVTGRVDEALFAGAPDAPDTALRLSARVTVVVVTDDGKTLTVGGWGAMVEDVEAARITVEDVEAPPGTDAGVFSRL
ncbi:TrmB family transcriptional regulator [Halosegnis sp.]|uniref:TrmB family transcriptional regulator n=1 Tax=Halosegnis sp. TaxID=2864959 RepID=UPI0035D4B2C0